jgi:hypothetical protein
MIGLTYTIIPMTKTTKIISTLPAQKYQIIYYISQHNIYITEDPFITIYSITNHNLLFYLFLYFNLTLSFIYIYIYIYILDSISLQSYFFPHISQVLCTFKFHIIYIPNPTTLVPTRVNQ